MISKFVWFNARLFRLRLAFFLTGWLFAQSVFCQTVESQFATRGESYFTFRIAKDIDFKELSTIISIDHVTGDSVVANASLEGFRKFLEMGIDYHFLPHTSALISDEAVSFDAIALLNDWNYYPTYDAYLSLMNAFESNHPALCNIITIGTLPSGRKLLAARITGNANPPVGKPKFLYTASIHGDELAVYVLSLRLIDHLLTNYGSNAYITRLVDSVEIWINPLANPDGAYYLGNHTISGARRRNANNVDLNRNFPDPAAGPNPDGFGWQPETVFFMEFAENQRFNISSNWHGGAECCNYPWDTWQKLAADNAWWVYTMREFADTIHAFSPSPFFRGFDAGITNGYAWYTITGGRQDYMNYFQQCREFTLELSNSKIPASSQLPVLWNYSHRSFLNYIEQALYGVRGVIRDSLSGEPIRAKVSITGYDQDSSVVYSNLPAGNYHRYLYTGVYDLTFSAPGYRTKVISGVNVLNRQTAWLDVVLGPLEGSVPHPDRTLNLKVYPNPVTAGFLIIESKNPLGNIELLDASGRVLLVQQTDKQQLRLEVSGLQKGLYFLKVYNDAGFGFKKVVLH